MHAVLKLTIGAVVAVVLQVMLAPNIAILGAQPNFILVYVITVAMIHQGDASTWFAFLLGFLYDMLTTQPIGVMAALLIVVTFVSSRVFNMLNNDTVWVPMIVAMFGSLVVEILYALVWVVVGGGAGMADALLLRALPCALYDCAMVLIVLPLGRRTYSSDRQQQAIHVTPETTIRLR